MKNRFSEIADKIANFYVKFLKAVLIILIVIPIVAEAANYYRTSDSPLRGSDRKVRAKLHELTPIGLTLNDVKDILSKESFYDLSGPEYSGLWVKDSIYPATYREIEQGGCHIIGKFYVRAQEYIGGIFGCDVFAYWVFDKDRKLIGIYILKPRWIAELQ